MKKHFGGRGLMLGLLGLAGLVGGCGADDGVPGRIRHDALSYSSCSVSSGHYLYLDGECNGQRVKTRPGKHGLGNAEWREWRCPNRGWVPAGYLSASTSLQSILPHVDTLALKSLQLPAGLSLSVIDVRRDSHGRPHYRHFATAAAPPARESWSASKFMAVAAAATRMREDSGHQLGLTSTARSGEQLGNLITWIHNYQNGGRHASNALARYFLNIAGRNHANGLMTGWLGAGSSRLGANYGPFYPDGVSYTFDEGSSSQWISHTSEAGSHKRISTLASAEFLKRLVMHREDAATRLPGFRSDADAKVLWRDLKMLFYGTHGWYWGGMQEDTAIYLESALDLAAVDQQSQGNWRIFSKLGHGISSSRHRIEFVYTGYGCFPMAGAPGGGVELVVAAHHSLPSGSNGRTMDKHLARAVRQVVQGLKNGTLLQQAAQPNTQPGWDIQKHWAAAEIQALRNQGVITGYPDGTIRPDRTLTRAELAALLAGAIALPPRPQCQQRSFSDMEGHWAEAPVHEVARACYMAGYPDGTFRPDAPVTRTEMLVTLAADSVFQAGQLSELSRYRDKHKIAGWARQGLATATAGGLVYNYPELNRLEPGAHATRAETAAAVHRLLVMRGVLPPIPSPHQVQ